jgi:hypothetical protein
LLASGRPRGEDSVFFKLCVCLGFALCCKLSNSILVSFSRSGFINLKQGIRAFRLNVEKKN